ncbi:hypothetical protein ACIQ2D_08955 [Lysinibacillus sp. NPDC097287]|uniref:hypothetical protein n=1 Tax=Lysinibacillus sp. NPDC097287 TaxID=3364144 RepID=UPI00382FD790
MKKVHVLIFGSLILATIVGVFGQGIAYFMNENIVKTYPIYYLTALTMISIFLYLVTFALTYIYFKKLKNENDIFGLYLFAICFLGLPTSLWSLFVLAMWWG